MAADEEKQAEADKFKEENEELKEKLRRLQLDREKAESTVPDNTLNEIWAALGLLQKQIVAGSSVQMQAAAAVQQNVEGISTKIDQILKSITKQRERLDSLELKHPVKFSWKKANSKETVLIVGGLRYHESLSRMTIWNKSQAKWTELDLELPHGLGWGGAAYLNEEIYIFGGCPKPKSLYKLGKHMKWTQLADMNEGRGYISNCSLEIDGFIWVFGGNNNFGPLKSVERYDPKKNEWTLMPQMKYVRSFGAAAVWNGKVIICGGRGCSNVILSSVECFDPQLGLWSEWEKLPSPRSGHSLVSYQNRLILMGGYIEDLQAADSVLELVHPTGNENWKKTSTMKIAAVGFPGIVLDYEIFAIGGLYNGREDLNRVEIFKGNQWRNGPRLPYEARNMPAFIIPQHYADLLCKE